MRSTLLTLIVALLFALLLAMSSSAQAQGQSQGVVTAAALNVRAGPGTGYAILGVVRRGETVGVLGRSGGWLQVTWRGGQGWVGASYVRVSGTPPSASRPTTPPSTSRPSASGGAGKIVFALSPGGPIYTVNADGSGLRHLAAGIDPAWSPTGDRVAFADWNEPQGLYVIRADGGGRERLFSGNRLKAPSWSPDGSRIAFTQQTGGRLDYVEECFFGHCVNHPPDPHWRLGVLSVGSREFRTFPDDLHSFSPAWRSNSEILFDGDPGLRLSGPERSDPATTLNDDPRFYDPRICAASGQIAATFYQHDHWEVYRVNADGSGMTRLTGSEHPLAPPVSNNAAPAWSPDCTQLLFMSDRDGRWRPYVMNADGSNQRPFLPQVMDALSFTYTFNSDRVFDWVR